MSQYSDSRPARPFELDSAREHNAIVSFFNAVYAWMFVGLAVTTVVGLLASRNAQSMLWMYQRGAGIAIVLGLVLLAWGIRHAALRISAGAATALFLLYAAIMGLLLSWIFLVYSTTTLVAALGLTAGTFGGMSLWGYLTKKDLSSWGSFLIMMVWGLFLASIVNIFIASSVFSWVITYAVLFVFIGLTAYDTQKLKEIAYATQGNGQLAARYAIIGSLMLYLDFINIFLSILRILGSRR